LEALKVGEEVKEEVQEEEEGEEEGVKEGGDGEVEEEGMEELEAEERAWWRGSRWLCPGHKRWRMDLSRRS
jgi:hypothetical protein